MSESYQVLARTYRPRSFADNFLGQQVTLQVLSQAIRSGKIPHAMVLSGIRGIGKTTTARIIARTLNCHNLIYQEGIPVPCHQCPSCRSLDDESSLDVIEVDAASRTGVDDIRDILESLPYKPSFGAYKVFIIDEVHMLSKSAFNALLKNLEEPPAHVKFIFATTEASKIPATILSRCMRFELRPFTQVELRGHLADILVKESIVMEPEALDLIVEAAQGSARDALSLADQVRHLGYVQEGKNTGVGASSPITAQQVRHLLGRAEKNQILDLMDNLLRGQIVEALRKVQDFYAQGVAPGEIAQAIMEFLYVTSKETVMATLGKTPPEGTSDGPPSLTIPLLQTLWHVVSKGYEDIRRSPLPEAALEMLLIRLTHVRLSMPASCQPPAQGLGQIEKSQVEKDQRGKGQTIHEEGENAPPRDAGDVSLPPSSSATPPLASAAMPRISAASLSSFQDIVALAKQHREPLLASHLVQDVHFVSLSPGSLCLKLTDHAPRDLCRTLQTKLSLWTGEPWTVTQSDDFAEPTLMAQKAERVAQLQAEATKNPLVQQVLDAFPGSEVVKIAPIRHTATSS